ncbi:hypothetical protein MCOR17_006498 [Pyricularia oryzae]|nr:hypothetical protein MCOR17_006498 [Pyricularia oryzae]
MGFFGSVLAQMIICGIIALLGPGLWNANNSLGAGGALEPYLVNAGNSIVFAFMGIFSILSPVFVNWIGVKQTLILGTLGWSIYSGALYQNNRFGTEWFVIVGAVICGISAGFYWAAEGAVILSYPEHRKRGRYLALWMAFKNSGQMIGGSINLGLNAGTAVAGKVSWVTLLVFVCLQALSLPVALLLSPPHKVERRDGSPIHVEQRTPMLEQLRRIWTTVSTRRVGLLLPVFFSCWFYWGYGSTFLTLYFTVRVRALASFLSAVTGTIACILFGVFLDSDRFTVKQRLRWGFLASCGPFTLIWIWVFVVQYDFNKENPGALDWLSPGFGRAFGAYIMLNTVGNMVQNFLYFLVGTIGDGTSEMSRLTGLLRGVESWGQCASFGISSSKFNLLHTVIINLVLWVVSLVPAFISVWEVEERKHAGAVESAETEGKAEPASKVGVDEEVSKV